VDAETTPGQIQKALESLSKMEAIKSVRLVKLD
jgi:hypothetical protein